MENSTSDSILSGEDHSMLEKAFNQAVDAKDEHIKTLTYLTELMAVCYDEYYHLPPKVKQTLKTISDRFNGERGN